MNPDPEDENRKKRRRKKRHTPIKALSYAVYVVLRSIAFFVAVCPDWIVYPCLRCLGRWIYRLHGPLRRRVRTNLRIAFGDTIDAREVDRIGMRATENLTQLFADTVKIARYVTHENAERYFDFVGFELLDQMQDRKTGVVCLTGHIGSFEAAGHAWGLKGYTLNSVSRPMKNRYLYDWLSVLRAKTGQTFIPRKGALRHVLRFLKDGRHVAFLFDQNQRKDNIFIPFLGRIASTTPAPAFFALRIGAPIIFGYARRLGGRFRFEAVCQEFIVPPEEGTQDERIAETMRRANQALEKAIRKYPEDYFWFHDRWRTRPPEELVPESEAIETNP